MAFKRLQVKCSQCKGNLIYRSRIIIKIVVFVLFHLINTVLCKKKKEKEREFFCSEKESCRIRSHCIVYKRIVSRFILICDKFDSFLSCKSAEKCRNRVKFSSTEATKFMNVIVLCQWSTSPFAKKF